MNSRTRSKCPVIQRMAKNGTTSATFGSRLGREIANCTTSRMVTTVMTAIWRNLVCQSTNSSVANETPRLSFIASGTEV